MSRVLIKAVGTEAVATTHGYLGNLWGAFQYACSAHGFRWNKKRGDESANIGSLVAVADFANDLTSKGIEVVLDEKAKEHLKRLSQTGLTPEEEEALKHVERVEEVVGKRGLRLWRPFQADGATFLASRRSALLGDDVGTGKQHPIDTKVMTPYGWREIGEIRPGDEVIGSDGRATIVTGVFPQGVKPSYRVTFSDGSSVEAGPEHLWSMRYRSDGRAWKTIVLTTDQLRTLPKVETSCGTMRDLSKTPLYLPMLLGPVQTRGKEPPIRPYLMGQIIANGYTQGTGASITSNSMDADAVHAEISLSGHELGPVKVYGGATRVSVRGVIATLRDMGLDVASREKRIPAACLIASAGYRRQLLCGLMDADGTISSSGCRVLYCTTSKGLAEDVVALVQSLGGIASVRVHDRSHDNKPTEYSVRIRLRFCPFLCSERKASRWVPGSHAMPVRTLDRVEYVRDVESVCISVSAVDHLYLTENCILTHNTVQSLVALPFSASAFIVCPAIAIMTWAQETLKWRPDLGVTVVLRGVTKARTLELADRGIRVVPEPYWPGSSEVVIVNYESMPVIPRQPGAKPDKEEDALEVTMKGEPYVQTVLIGDEIHRCKNRKAKVTRKWRRMSDAVRAAKGSVWGLSGTPMTNRPFDLSSVLTGLGCLYDVFTSWADFVRRMGGQEGAYGMEWSGRVDPSVATSMRRVMLRREKEDVMPYLPAKTYKVVEVEGTTSLDSIADELLKRLRERGVDIDSLLMREYSDDDDPEEDAKDILKYLEIGELSKLHATLSEVGYAAAIPLIDEYEEAEEPLVVFCAHRGPVEALGEREGWVTILGGDNIAERAEKIRRFQAGELKGIALTISAGRENITLHRASNALFLSQSWSPAENHQAEGRIHRGGQQRGCLIIQIVPDHPLVSRLISLLNWKRGMTDVAIGAASVIRSVAQDRMEASQRILGEEVRAKAAGEAGKAPRQEYVRVEADDPIRSIPGGGYALDSKPDSSGKTHTVFWIVDKPTKANWKGWIFLKFQKGPEAVKSGSVPCPEKSLMAAASTVSVLRRIAEDPVAASSRYGRELGVCGVCGRALTDETSRAEGIGPICKAKFGGA